VSGVGFNFFVAVPGCRIVIRDTPGARRVQGFEYSDGSSERQFTPGEDDDGGRESGAEEPRSKTGIHHTRI